MAGRDSIGQRPIHLEPGAVEKPADIGMRVETGPARAQRAGGSAFAIAFQG